MVAGRSRGVGAAGRNGFRALGLQPWRGFVIPMTVGGAGGVESCDFRREISIIADFTYDFRWEVLKFTISTSHFMVCFEHLTKKVSILCCVLRATVAKYCKIHR